MSLRKNQGCMNEFPMQLLHLIKGMCALPVPFVDGIDVF